MFPLASSAVCLLALLLVARSALAQDPVQFTKSDISSISFYGPSAVYRPDSCPSAISFNARARPLAELAPGTLGMYTSEIQADGQPCTASTPIISFFPIGRTDHLPPQWLFEHAVQKGLAVNLTCGDWKFTIRYGYVNDVKTPDGYLDPTKAYLDFAVYPYVMPFAFCSYVSQRTDQTRAVDFAPFPTLESWNAARAANNLPPVSDANGAETDDETAAVPSPEADDGAQGSGGGGALERIVERLSGMSSVIGPEMKTLT